MSNIDWERVKTDWVKENQDIHPIVLQHLYNQGVTLDKVTSVLNPDYELQLYDWRLLPDINKTVNRIITAINDNDKVLVFTDYDADGIPGAAILDTFFKKIGFTNYSLQTPNRNVDGFGLKPQHVEKAVKDEVNLLITIDCGSASGLAIEIANHNNIEVIVTDHHEVPDLNLEEQPYAMVNPMRTDSEYTFSQICGAFVVFKLVQGLITEGKKQKLSWMDGINEGWEKWLLDLVAIATVGDMMPLIDENRTATYFGLKVLNQTRNYGLRALIDNAKLTRGEINTTDISFRIAPRINAASRMGHGDKALELLTADNPVTAGNLALELEKLNNERRKVVTQMVKTAHKELGKVEDFNGSVVAIGKPDWLPGTCGLLASRLVEKYGVSAFVWGRGPGKELKGSCRAAGGDNVYQILQTVGDKAFKTFGGHVDAGGFVLKTDKAHELQNLLTSARDETSDHKLETIAYEPETDETSNFIPVQPADITIDILHSLAILEPTGHQFSAVVFKLDLKILQDTVLVSQFGKNNEHLKLLINSQLSGIKWRTKASDYNLSEGALEIDLVILASLEYDSYSQGPRLLIQDIKAAK